MKSFRFIDLAILLAIIVIVVGLVIRLRHPDFVSQRLTDLSRREEVTVHVAVPPPWRRPPLAALLVHGDSQVVDRDRAIFQSINNDDTYPVAIFKITARIDPEKRRWFNYSEVIPGASFTFQTASYRMDGLILEIGDTHR